MIIELMGTRKLCGREEPNFGFFPVEDKVKCDLCKNYFVEGKTFQSFSRKYFIKSDFQCTSSNVVYLVSCKSCHLQCVRSTKTEFKVRFRNRKSAMRTYKKTCEVAVHYNSSPHVMQDFTFQCINKF